MYFYNKYKDFYYYPQNKKTESLVVIGGGIMGSMATYYLSQNSNCKVTLIDTNHAIRSSWGESRSIHHIQKNKLFSKMVMKDFELWNKIEKRENVEIIKHTDRFHIGSLSIIFNLIENFLTYNIPFTLYNQNNISKNYPFVKLNNSEMIIKSPGGIIMVNKALQATQKEKSNVSYLHDTAVLSIDRKKKIIITDKGIKLNMIKLLLLQDLGLTVFYTLRNLKRRFLIRNLIIQVYNT